jgi:hypothetical protein
MAQAIVRMSAKYHHRLRYRSASVGTLLLMAATPAGADEPTATMTCERASAPGRIKCSVEAHVPAARTIAWADVALVELPDFVTALKGRLGPADVTAHDPAMHAWAYGLVAKKVGDGQARATVRLLVCERADKPRCVPIAVEVKATVHVGP